MVNVVTMTFHDMHLFPFQSRRNRVAPKFYFSNFYCEMMVAGAGVEPAQLYSRGILSPLCLPIPPPGHNHINSVEYFVYLLSLTFSGAFDRT